MNELKRAFSSRRTAISLLIGIAFGSLILHATIPVIPYDDAYITFRYARNFIQTYQPVYNTGQYVFGSSTPVFTFWLAGLSSVFPCFDIPFIAVKSNLILAALGLSPLIFFVLIKCGVSQWIALTCAAITAFDPRLMFVFSGGMESVIFTCFILLTILACTIKKPITAGILTSLTMLTRPEGIVLLLPGCLIYGRNKTKSLKYMLAFSIITGIWVIFAFVYFGTPIPHSIIAKLQPLYPIPMGDALRKISEYIGIWFGFSVFIPIKYLAETIGWLILISSSVWAYRQTKSLQTKTIATVFWSLLGLYVLGNPLITEWYIPHIMVLAMLLFFVGFFQEIPEDNPSNLRLFKLIRIISGYLIALLILLSTFFPYLMNETLEVTAQNIKNDPQRMRVIGYEKAAEYLVSERQLNKSVLAPEIGALGYYFSGRIYDACGLVSPEALEFLPVPAQNRPGPEWGSIPGEFVKKIQPDWIVTLPIFGSQSIGSSQWFKNQYRLVHTVDLPFTCWSNDRVLLFARINNLN